MQTLKIKEVDILQEYKDVLTFSELKSILKIGKNQTYSLLQNNIIPSIRIGRDYRILKVDLINYLKNSN